LTKAFVKVLFTKFLMIAKILSHQDFVEMYGYFNEVIAYTETQIKHIIFWLQATFCQTVSHILNAH